jgi:hypothetical protein
MQSPFPGMDPYLEDRRLWSSVHHRLISVISDMLTALVTPHFFVSIEERVYITDLPDGMETQAVPDLYLVQRPRINSQPARATTLAPTEPTIIEALSELEVRDRYIEIRDSLGQEVVTTIEVVSPRNKARNSKGRSTFLRKRRSMLASETNWIEIDLLRGGERPPEVAGQSDYYALLKRRGQERFAVWFVDLRDALPVISVPLREPHNDVLIDLGAAIKDMYMRGTYAARIDYTQPPPPPALAPADAAWVRQQVAGSSGQD